MITLMGVLCILLLLIGTPIFIALGLPPLIAILLLTDITPTVIVQQLWGGMDKFALMSMPFFVYAANVMGTGGLSKRLIDWTISLVGRMPGGLGVATQLSSMFFGAVSGSSPAAVAGIGKIMYPALVEHNYDRSFRNGLIASGPAVAILIPPSITMVVYGSITGTSVGALFIAGIGAGIVYGGVTLAYCIYRAKREHMKPLKAASFKEIIEATIKAIWTLGVPVIILGGIYFGVFTPTEASGVSVIYAILVSVLVYRELGWDAFFRVSLESAVLSAELMLLTGAASALGWVATIAQLPQMMFEGLLSFTNSPYLFFLLANILLLIMGMFIDGVPAVVIVAPLLAPLAQKLGINLIHFGIVLTANMAIGMFTAPFGLNLFVAADITQEPFERIAVDCIPFIIVSIIGLILLTYLPEISLWLPRLVYGKN